MAKNRQYLLFWPGNLTKLWFVPPLISFLEETLTIVRAFIRSRRPRKFDPYSTSHRRLLFRCISKDFLHGSQDVVKIRGVSRGFWLLRFWTNIVCFPMRYIDVIIPGTSGKADVFTEYKCMTSVKNGVFFICFVRIYINQICSAR
jgi:hypothetical protein